MQKKPSKYALVALFLALVMLPPLAGVVAGSRVKSRNLELRTPAAKPALTLAHIGSFPREYEAWYADSQPFRDQLIYVRALMNRMGMSYSVRTCLQSSKPERSPKLISSSSSET